jgi:hypothetical protein
MLMVDIVLTFLRAVLADEKILAGFTIIFIVNIALYAAYIA